MSILIVVAISATWSVHHTEAAIITGASAAPVSTDVIPEPDSGKVDESVLQELVTRSGATSGNTRSLARSLRVITSASANLPEIGFGFPEPQLVVRVVSPAFCNRFNTALDGPLEPPRVPLFV